MLRVEAWSLFNREANSQSLQRGKVVEKCLETIDLVPGRRVHYSRTIQKIDPPGGYCRVQN